MSLKVCHLPEGRILYLISAVHEHNWSGSAQKPLDGMKPTVYARAPPVARQAPPDRTHNTHRQPINPAAAEQHTVTPKPRRVAHSHRTERTHDRWRPRSRCAPTPEDSPSPISKQTKRHMHMHPRHPFPPPPCAMSSHERCAGPPGARSRPVPPTAAAAEGSVEASALTSRYPPRTCARRPARPSPRPPRACSRRAGHRAPLPSR